MNRSKASVAEALVQAHYLVEPGIVRIVRLLSSAERENDPKEPIKLLEVNENTTADGIRPVYFGPRPSNGVIFPSVIVEVTPDEFENIRENPSLLPNDWRLGDEFPRVSVAGVEH